MVDIVLYGLNEAGEPAFAERFEGGADRESLRARARERLKDWWSVELWEGPLCILRLRRKEAPAG